MNRAKVNYWVDVAIGLAGVISALSGLVFLLPGDLTSGVLGISYQVWNAVHTWSSLAAVLGVGAHLALHWKWLVSMTRRTFAPLRRQEAVEPVSALGYGGAQGTPMSRRTFLALGGTAAIVTGLIVAGYKAIFEASPAEASVASSQNTTTQQGSGVACPFGLVNDPYPGRCRRYRDSNGDGICDYSVAGSGTNLSTSGGGSWGGGFSQHRSGFGQP